jgi:hypothetical protein
MWRETTFKRNESEAGDHFILPEHFANGIGIFEAVIAKDEICATVIDAFVKKVFAFGFNTNFGGYILGAFNPRQLPRLPSIQFPVESLFACCTNRIH